MKIKPIYELILFERRNIGIVYHFTSLFNCISILQDNKLKAKKMAFNGRSLWAISTTRDKNFSNHRRTLGMEPVIGGDEICIVLDGTRLSDHYKTFSHDDTVHYGRVSPYRRSSWGDEMEQVWTGELISKHQGINGIKKYIQKLIMTKYGQNVIRQSSRFGIDTDGDLSHATDNRPDNGIKFQMLEDYFEQKFKIKVEFE